MDTCGCSDLLAECCWHCEKVSIVSDKQLRSENALSTHLDTRIIRNPTRNKLKSCVFFPLIECTIPKHYQARFICMPSFIEKEIQSALLQIKGMTRNILASCGSCFCSKEIRRFLLLVLSMY